MNFIVGLLLVLAAAPVPQARRGLDLEPGELTVYFTGAVGGELTSCGCKTDDYGGLTRRAAYLDTMRATGREYLALDAGGFMPPGEMNAQKRLKVETLARATAIMGYHAISLGPEDLQHGPELAAEIVGWLGSPVVATNYDLGAGRSERSRLVTAGGRKVGVLAFLDEGLAGAAPWLAVEPWGGQAEVVEALRAEADLVIAMAQIPDRDAARRLLDLVPGIDVVVACHGKVFPAEVMDLDGTFVVGTGSQGRYLGHMEVRLEEDGVTADAVYLPVIKAWGFRPRIDRIVAEYNRKVKELIFSDEMD